MSAATPEAAAVVQFLDNAEPLKVEPPRPLLRPLPPAKPFPVGALGPILEGAALAIHDRTQAPLAICAQSVLAAAALATQGHADVELPTGQRRPLSNFFLTIAATGERKSACDHHALWPIHKREAALREAYAPEAEAYANDRDAFEAARRKALTKGKDRASMRAALEAIGPEPAAPLEPILTAPEPTFEGLAKLLARGQPSVGVFSSEGGQFVGGHGMTDEAKLRTAAGFSALWDGEPVKRVRAGDGATVLPGRRVSLHLMVQPDVAAGFLSDRLLRDQGLLSRCLVAAPESAMGGRLWREPSDECTAALGRYGARLLAILEAPLPLAAGRRNELSPRVLPLAPKARAAWIRLADHTEVNLAGELAPIAGLANKLPEHAARLAAVLTLVDNLGAGEIALDAIVSAAALVEYYASEALRLHSAGAADPDLVEAQRLLAWCQAQPGGLVSLPDMYQRGPNAIRDAAKAKKLAAILEAHGWLVRLPDGAEVNGVRRREAFRVVEGTP